jgi:uncharacterized protein (TIGR03083 family)
VDLTPSQLDELLGPWALGALEGEEAELVEAAIAASPDLALRALALERVVALLGEWSATPAPPQLRESLLHRAALEAPPGVAATEPVALFARQVATLAELVGSLDDRQWRQPAEPYPWTVHELVAHLVVIERYTAHQLDIAPEWAPTGSTAHLELGSGYIAAARLRPPAETTAAWHEAALATIGALRSSDGPGLDAPVELHGWPFTAAMALIARAFETWTHTDDIRRAIGAPPQAPEPSDLRAMSAFSVGTLAELVPLVAPEAPLAGGRVVLTGDGGGTYDLGDPSRRQVTLVADVVGYCRLVAGRLDPGELAAAVEGDQRAADHLLAAAQLFAV